MDYTNFSREQLLNRIKSLEMLNNELLKSSGDMSQVLTVYMHHLAIPPYKNETY
ncbi:hypothetical protein DES36_101172 [Alkalibaculum bacchi]|uniref:Uncharacterized protein n=1 Tax=Alkalibaculum bacchi TaxID=645887 RepID=A0A366IG43_9FIRM|nr:hypothetical protein [Alkalibaculum bacchi]RBP70117.1 hypothetical protein DES36_101172 [Alkalibaculum bacchi]